MPDTDDRHREEVPTPTGEDGTRTTRPGRGGPDDPHDVSGGSAGTRAPETSGPEELDHDLNIRAVVWSGVILAAVTALSFVLMWWLFQGLVAFQAGRDPEPPPIREAAEPTLPDGPVLQSEPEEDWRRMLAMEEALLTSYSLVEGEEGYARVPIEVALEMALERGLGEGAEGMSGTGLGTGGGDGMSADGEAVEQPEAAGAAEGGQPSADDSGTEGTPADDTQEQPS